MQNFITDPEPPEGSIITAYSNDGSMAMLYKRIGDRWFDDVDAEKAIAENGVDWQWFADAMYFNFVLMPKRFKMWHERKRK